MMKKTSNDHKEVKSQKRNQAALSTKRSIDVVTGPTSGVGVKLIRRLLEKGDEVRVVVLEHPTDEFWKRLPSGVMPYVANLKLINPDDEHNLQAACVGADRIFHLAALTDLRTAPVEEFIKVNVIGTENLLKAFVSTNPPDKPVHFIYLGSTSVYGSKRPGEVLTEESELKPSGTYGETKLMAEQVVKSFAAAHESIKYTILRVSNMYGPYYEGSFNKIFRYIKQQKLRYIGSGNNHLTLVHVDDVIDGIITALGNPNSVNNVFNLTDGEPYTLKQLFDKAADFLGAPRPNKHIHPVLAVIRAQVFKINRAELNFMLSDRVISISKIKKELHFEPKRSLDNEGKNMVNEFLSRYKE
jgi:nucleoside-diphosphate-sugar epimerase